MGIRPTGADRASLGWSSLDGSITGEAQRRTCHVRSEVVPGASAGGGGGAGGAHPAGRYGAAYVACQHEEADDHESDDGSNDSPSAELNGHRMTIRRLGAGSTPAAALVEGRQQKRDRQDHAEGERCHDGRELGHDGSLITAGERVEDQPKAVPDNLGGRIESPRPEDQAHGHAGNTDDLGSHGPDGNGM